MLSAPAPSSRPPGVSVAATSAPNCSGPRERALPGLGRGYAPSAFGRLRRRPLCFLRSKLTPSGPLRPRGATPRRPSAGFGGGLGAFLRSSERPPGARVAATSAPTCSGPAGPPGRTGLRPVGLRPASVEGSVARLPDACPSASARVHETFDREARHRPCAEAAAGGSQGRSPSGAEGPLGPRDRGRRRAPTLGARAPELGGAEIRRRAPKRLPEAARGEAPSGTEGPLGPRDRGRRRAPTLGRVSARAWRRRSYRGLSSRSATSSSASRSATISMGAWRVTRSAS